MESSEITNLIQAELSSRSRPLRPHPDLDRCLVAPTRASFAGKGEGNISDFWLVLEEQPETQDGYKIVFDEQTRQFGLATGKRKVFIGFYGTFITTLEAM
jgi:hypothetical protein